jgi:hypothetical protein
VSQTPPFGCQAQDFILVIVDKIGNESKTNKLFKLNKSGKLIVIFGFMCD